MCENFERYISAAGADGVPMNETVVLPCKIGSDLWWIDVEERVVKCEKNGIKAFVVKENEVLVLDEGFECAIGERLGDPGQPDEDHVVGTVFLTQACAEKWLAAMQDG